MTCAMTALTVAGEWPDYKHAVTVISSVTCVACALGLAAGPSLSPPGNRQRRQPISVTACPNRSTLPLTQGPSSLPTHSMPLTLHSETISVRCPQFLLLHIQWFKPRPVHGVLLRNSLYICASAPPGKLRFQESIACELPSSKSNGLPGI